MVKVKQQFISIVVGVISIFTLLLIWYLAVEYTQIKLVFPDPFKVFSYLLSSIINKIGKYTLPQHIWFSLNRVLIGYGLSSLCGIILGVAMGYSKTINAIVSPIFNLIRPIPGLAWIPLAILWFGVGESTKWFIIFMGGFANVVLNSFDGTNKVDAKLVSAAKLLGASEAQIFFKIILPSATPYIFAGLQVSLSTSWMAVLAAEMVSSNKGCGWVITTGMNNGDTVQILVGMLAIGIVGFVLANIMRVIERRLCSWAIREN
jgi:NitT/TauT family transport system permease protein/sulfonate transport system permease protein